jgi:hypothetical protein
MIVSSAEAARGRRAQAGVQAATDLQKSETMPFFSQSP